MRMTEAEFENERRYQMLMYHVKRMLRSGIISEEEFLEIDTRYCHNTAQSLVAFPSEKTC